MSSIVRDEQGAFHWVYEFNLFTNPTILFTVLKILLGIIVIGICIMLIGMVPDIMHGYADMDDLLETLRFGGLFVLFFAALTCVGYAVYAAMQGGKYCVVFTMNERGILHKQLPKQYDKARAMSALGMVVGAATMNPTLVGMSLTSARDSLSSDFSAVRSVKGSRALRVIKVNEPFAKNQVYVDPQDYDFVFDYIREHCPNATKVSG